MSWSSGHCHGMLCGRSRHRTLALSDMFLVSEASRSVVDGLQPSCEFSCFQSGCWVSTSKSKIPQAACWANHSSRFQVHGTPFRIDLFKTVQSPHSSEIMFGLDLSTVHRCKHQIAQPSGCICLTRPCQLLGIAKAS